MVMTISIKTVVWCELFASRFQPELILKVILLFCNFGGLRNLQDTKSLPFITNFTSTHLASLVMPTPAITGCEEHSITSKRKTLLTFRKHLRPSSG
jgi:hypothetical protein